MEDHPIQPWSMYAHFQSTSDTYKASYYRISYMDTIEDWARTWNNCRPDLIGGSQHAILIQNQRINSWSLFRNSIHPTWEDPSNAHGTTLTHRTNVHEIDAAHIWSTLIVECIRGATPDCVLGVQVTQRPSKNTTLVKFDAWLRNDGVDICAAKAWLSSTLSIPFTVTLRHSPISSNAKTLV